MFIFIVCNQKARNLILSAAALRIWYITLKMFKANIISVFYAEEVQAPRVMNHEHCWVGFLLPRGVTVSAPLSGWYCFHY